MWAKRYWSQSYAKWLLAIVEQAWFVKNFLLFQMVKAAIVEQAWFVKNFLLFQMVKAEICDEKTPWKPSVSWHYDVLSCNLPIIKSILTHFNCIIY